MKTLRHSWLFFLALVLFYYSLSPGAIAGMGYGQENIEAGNQLMSNLGHWLTFRHASTSVVLPRHGLYEPLLEIPFLALGRLVFGSSFAAADRGAALQPVVVTALLCTLILIWVRRITASAVWGYVLGLSAAFSTLLWPYAYIGLEPSQSLFVILAGFIALSSNRKRGWLLSIAFAFSCGLAISIKSNGLFLIPAVAFIVFCYFRPEGYEPVERPSINWKKVVAVVAIVAALYFINDRSRSLSATSQGGALSVFKTFGIHNPLFFFVNMFSLLFSINKGLIIFSPPILLSLLTIGRVYRDSSRVAVFATLALLGLMAGSSLMWAWTDETWGPRYLHSAIGPLIVCFAVTKKAIRFRFRKEIPLLVLVILGTAVSFLGTMFYYGNLQRAATVSSHATIETFQYDPNWNHIRFNAKLLKLWIGNKTGVRSDEVELWPPVQRRWYAVGDEAPFVETKQVDLRNYAIPQPAILRSWPSSNSMLIKVYRAWFLVCLLVGSALLAWLGRQAVREERIFQDPIPRSDLPI